MFGKNQVVREENRKLAHCLLISKETDHDYITVMTERKFAKRVVWTKKMKHQIHLVPVGDMEAAAVEEIRKRLEMTFDIPVKKEDSIPVPNDTFVPFREQYHAPAILTRLRASYPSELGFAIVLGIINRDIFVPDLNFVFGLADAETRTALIALYKLHPEIYGLPSDEEVFRGRAAKEAIHELGHVYGLTHCPDPSLYHVLL